MGVKFLLTSLAIAALFSGCQSSGMTKDISKLDNEATAAETKASEFFSALQHRDRQKILAIYPAFKQLQQTQSSNAASFRSISEKDGALVITFRNTQNVDRGFRKEKDVQLFFRPDAKGEMIVFDSKGLGDFERREEYLFGLKTGCINANRDTTDQQMAQALARSGLLLPEKAFGIYMELKQGIQVTNWTWEPGDNGSAFGEGVVHNGSSYSLPELKYKITYQDSNGDTLATDKGNVTYEKVQPGDNPTFTFYTSSVGKPTKAVIELVFEDDLVFSFLLKKAWTGKEWQEYSGKMLTKK